MNCIHLCKNKKKYSVKLFAYYSFQISVLAQLDVCINFFSFILFCTKSRPNRTDLAKLAVVILRKGNANKGNHAQGESQLGVFHDQLYNHSQKKSSQAPCMEMRCTILVVKHYRDMLNSICTNEWQSCPKFYICYTRISYNIKNSI